MPGVFLPEGLGPEPLFLWCGMGFSQTPTGSNLSSPSGLCSSPAMSVRPALTMLLKSTICFKPSALAPLNPPYSARIFLFSSNYTIYCTVQFPFLLCWLLIVCFPPLLHGSKDLCLFWSCCASGGQAMSYTEQGIIICLWAESCDWQVTLKRNLEEQGRKSSIPGLWAVDSRSKSDETPSSVSWGWW